MCVSCALLKNCDSALIFRILGAILILSDLASDIVTSASHFWHGDVIWGSLTLTFVLLPGVISGIERLYFHLYFGVTILYRSGTLVTCKYRDTN